MDKKSGHKPRATFREYIWRAVLGDCVCTCYDFQRYKKTKPYAEDPEIVFISEYLPVQKEPPTPIGIEG